ncbi:MAG TPA: hypothetical protein VFQ25_16320 [Ktedonobacterales bacterium]|nr:hypothetical protein [Ktedonobacterales bacterium]
MSDVDVARPVDGARAEVWRAYWAARGMPWRTEPEIDGARRTYLAERRAVTADITRSAYPFKDITLTRADVEWLLATHESDGMRGPVDPDDPKQAAREGLDLRGAQLVEVDLSRLPLAALRAGLTQDEADIHGRDLSHAAAASMVGAKLRFTHLERACLARARSGGRQSGGRAADGRRSQRRALRWCAAEAREPLWRIPAWRVVQ